MLKIWKVNIRLSNVLTLYLCTLFLVQGGKWTGCGLSRSVFVTFASSKRGVTSLICCSVINIFVDEMLVCKMPPSNPCVFLSDMPAIIVVCFLLSHIHVYFPKYVLRMQILDYLFLCILYVLYILRLLPYLTVHHTLRCMYCISVCVFHLNLYMLAR